MAENFSAFDFKTQEEVMTVIKHLTATLSTTGMQLVEMLSPSNLMAQLHGSSWTLANDTVRLFKYASENSLNIYPAGNYYRFQCTCHTPSPTLCRHYAKLRDHCNDYAPQSPSQVTLWTLRRVGSPLAPSVLSDLMKLTYDFVVNAQNLF